MKLYLDTSIIWAWFRRFMESRKKKESLVPPSIIKFISSKRELELIASSLTKLEISRYLMSEWNCNEKDSEEIWESFLRTFNVSYTVVKEVDFEEIIKICKEVPTKKKTIVNLLHVQIAKKEGVWFLTGEEKLKEKYKKYYDNVLTYKDLRKKFA